MELRIRLLDHGGPQLWTLRTISPGKLASLAVTVEDKEVVDYDIPGLSAFDKFDTESSAPFPLIVVIEGDDDLFTNSLLAEDRQGGQEIAITEGALLDVGVSDIFVVALLEKLGSLEIGNSLPDDIQVVELTTERGLIMIELSVDKPI